MMGTLNLWILNMKTKIQEAGGNPDRIIFNERMIPLIEEELQISDLRRLSMIYGMGVRIKDISSVFIIESI